MEPVASIPPEGSSVSSDAESRRRGHETTDAHLRPIIAFIVIMIISAAVIQLVVLGLMHWLRHHNAAADPNPSPFADRQSAPPEPRLQPSITHPTQPHEDMATLHARWQQELTTYGMIRGESDRVRIPVARAMQMMAQNGIKVEPTPATQPATRPATSPSLPADASPGGAE
jgi:hypothetical protein